LVTVADLPSRVPNKGQKIRKANVCATTFLKRTGNEGHSSGQHAGNALQKGLSGSACGEPRGTRRDTSI